eukprot:1879819-Pleurochrysis_carterae.AAC.1
MLPGETRCGSSSPSPAPPLIPASSCSRVPLSARSAARVAPGPVVVSAIGGISSRFRGASCRAAY